MMKFSLFLLALLSCITLTAQTVAKKIALAKGQKLEQRSDFTTHVNTEMMGQAVENKIMSTVSSVVEITDSKAQTYALTSTLNKVVMNVTAMGQEIKFDSDKKEDLEGQYGTAFKGRIGVPYEFVINKNGVITEVKTKLDSNAQSAGLMMGMMGGTIGAEPKVGAPIGVLAHIPDQGLQVGGNWTDSSNDDNGRTTTTYTLKETRGDTGFVSLNSTHAVSRELEQQGVTMQLSMTGNTIGEYTFEISTGIITSRKSKTKTEGTIEVMGQSVPVSTETNMVTTVTKR